MIGDSSSDPKGNKPTKETVLKDLNNIITCHGRWTG
jgi:hypothetical protein